MRLGRFCRFLLSGAALAAALVCLSCMARDECRIFMEPDDGSPDRMT